MTKRVVILIGIIAIAALIATTVYFLEFRWTKRVAPDWIYGPLVVSGNTLFHGEWHGGQVHEWS